ncbi:stage VI sporulation protein D [Ornithinibacillus halophilus]|uniref:Stage VI sporulation protein D n=1 Tax=Ornithinibacillus halophilus TaxID=930117 RepID=A0A1M5DDH3_9BACI|nr:stage VI sporulation protein D [Ornithinibacillus halophilus]SHF64965.1 stage VI sporulation protein D [Ornithinibacillus halophilus]
MSNEQSVFSFELNESLFFEKGQEVEEIVGISLDPEISIQPFNDYISIRGVVELQGSYLMAQYDTSDSDEESFFSEGYQAKRYMERVEDGGSGGAVFSHRFPVEISIPSYRVDDLNDVSVMITEFDYELPASNQLQLKSTIEIHGISDQVEEPRYTETTEENDASADAVELEPESESEPLSSERAEESFEFEIKKENDEVESSESLNTNIPSLQDDYVEEESSESPEEKGRWKYKETQTLSEFFNKDNEEQDNESPNESPDVFYESPSPSPSVEYNDSPDTDDDESSESSSEKVKGLNFLSKLFRGEEEEEERYTKMRLCIVQENDTLESIAERYETTTLQITSQNKLDSDDVSAGQLLYIPYHKKVN